MTQAEVLDIVYETFQMAFQMAMPFLVVSIIAIFQAATQINEQTMTFVPKLLAVLAILGFLGSTMLGRMQEFVQKIFSMIAGG